MTSNNYDKIFLDNAFGDVSKAAALEQQITELSHKEHHADLDSRLLEVEHIQQIQQEQIEIINKIFQKVFGSTQEAIDFGAQDE